MPTNLPPRYPDTAPGSKKFLLKAVLATSVLLLIALVQISEGYYFRVSDIADRGVDGVAPDAPVTFR